MPDIYAAFTDEALIDRLRDGDAQITDYIMNKYKNLVRKKAKYMYILGADNDDLIQEGMIGLFKAVRDYDAGRDASVSRGRCTMRCRHRAGKNMHRSIHIFRCMPI